jgi:hypothetical protein
VKARLDEAGEKTHLSPASVRKSYMMALQGVMLCHHL